MSIFGVVITSRKNYREWYRNIKSALIFNDLWKGICEAKEVPQRRKTFEEDVELEEEEEEAESEEKSYVLNMKSSRPCRKPIILTTDKEHEI
jgi:hypothetical protein